VELAVGESLVYNFQGDIKDVLVADPKTANVVVRSLHRAYIIGIVPGETSIVFFDAEEKQMARFEITVMGKVKQRNVSNIEKEIRNLLCPGAQCVKVVSIGDGILLKGTVANQMEAQQAFDIASHFVDPCGALGNNDSSSVSNGSSSSSSSSTGCAASAPSGSGGVGAALNSVGESKIVNAIVVRGRDQVMLKVTVAEVERTVIKQFGINLSGSAGVGSAVVNFNTANPFPINGLPSDSIAGKFKSVTATLQAMEQAGVIHTLAEPTLSAISGESASFIAGGKFPYPTPPSAIGGAPGFDWQKFGVSLTFTPVVLSEGRISLKVMTEVSELNPQNSVTIAGTTVPGITTRNVDTTLEIPSGGSLAMAGLIQEQTKQQISGLPGLMQVPVLGALFKSRDYQNSQTELVVIVTPYIVRAVAAKNLSRPDDGFADASDPASILLGNLNRIYGVPDTSPPKRTYHGNIGFILD
jgi:pilus assembly protein CpaC